MKTTGGKAQTEHKDYTASPYGLAGWGLWEASMEVDLPIAGCLLEMQAVKMRRRMQDCMEENVKVPNKTSVNTTGKLWNINGHHVDLYWT